MRVESLIEKRGARTPREIADEHRAVTPSAALAHDLDRDQRGFGDLLTSKSDYVRYAPVLYTRNERFRRRM
jgi:hypothetical protein